MISTLLTVDAGSVPLTGVATAGLFVFLVARELADSREGDFLRALRRSLLVFAAPLLVVFATIVIVSCVRMIT